MTAPRNAVVSVTLTLEVRPVLRATKDGRACTVARGREGAGEGSRLWDLFALGDKARRELNRMGADDVIIVQGPIDVTVVQSATGSGASLRINVVRVRRPKAEEGPAVKRRGTRPIDPVKVAAANAEWARKHAGGRE